jgi:hypothetical protein
MQTCHVSGCGMRHDGARTHATLLNKKAGTLHRNYVHERKAFFLIKVADPLEKWPKF